MIDETTFAREWRMLCERFGKDASQDMAGRYLDYLSARMDTDAFRRASQVVWATNEFFPRPADFLVAEATAQWRILLDVVERFQPPHSTPSVYDALSNRGGDAVRELGGILAVKDGLNRDAVRFRRTWYDAYESAVALDAGQNVLPSGEGPKMLATGTDA